MAYGNIKCTVVSVYPFRIYDPKPGISFEVLLHPAPENGVSVLHVPMTSASRYVMDGQTIPIPVLPDKLAESIVFDFCANQLCYSAEASPGLFWVEGEISEADLLNPEKGFTKTYRDEKGNITRTEYIKYVDLIRQARERQVKWFEALVRMADDDWNRTRQHRAISDQQREAAKRLGITREWVDNMALKIVSCPACTTKVSDQAAVCMNCGCVLDEKKYKALKFVSKQTA